MAKQLSEKQLKNIDKKVNKIKSDFLDDLEKLKKKRDKIIFKYQHKLEKHKLEQVRKKIT